MHDVLYVFIEAKLQAKWPKALLMCLCCRCFADATENCGASAVVGAGTGIGSGGSGSVWILELRSSAVTAAQLWPGLFLFYPSFK